MLHSVTRSVRIPATYVREVGRMIVRLSLNPVLYARTQRLVRWVRESTAQVTPLEVILRAIRSYPGLSLSSAVETVLVDLLVEHTPVLDAATEKEVRRFLALPLEKQIQVARRRMKQVRYLRSLE